LHHLQMATELLGKAHAWRHGPQPMTHVAFVPFFRSLVSNRRAQNQLGFARRNEAWRRLIRTSIPLAQQVEQLAPTLAIDRPNPEYPWPRDDPADAPAEFTFEIWRALQQTSAGRRFVSLVERLLQSRRRFCSVPR
ncbi:MAG: hypothetical protein ACREHD_27650, partial [Pirellulales bacterium]